MGVGGGVVRLDDDYAEESTDNRSFIVSRTCIYAHVIRVFVSDFIVDKHIRVYIAELEPTLHADILQEQYRTFNPTKRH